MTMSTTLGIASQFIDNPFVVPAEMDRILPVRRDVPRYSETFFLTTWNPEAGVGLFIHVGRCPQDLDLWWARVLAYLPDGRIAVNRSWGRGSEGDTIQTGNLVIRMDRPLWGWTCSFDGAAELTTPELMARRPIGAGIARPMRLELRTEAAGPVWDLYGVLGRGQSQDWAQGTHTEQVLNVTGTLSVDGVEYALDGVGANDHSSGPRDLSNFGSGQFLIGSLPGQALHLLSVYGINGEPLMENGTVFRQGEPGRTAMLCGLPPLTAFDGGPRDFVAELRFEDGESIPLRIEVLHMALICISLDNDNINGVEFDERTDVQVLFESRVRITTPDGEVGYALLERSSRRSVLQAHVQHQ